MALTEDRARFLKKVSLLHGLSTKDLQTVARIARVRSVKKGQTIFSKAASGDALYVVVNGRVKIFVTSRLGRTKTFAYLEPGDFFGEMALLGRGGRTAGARAVLPSTLLTIHRRDFEKLLKSRPNLTYALLKTLSDRLRWADSEIESLSFNSVLGRIAHLLLDLGDRYGKKTPRGVRIDLTLSHQEMADMAGTAREMVTRVLQRFVRTNCLETDRRNFVITDANKLREWML
jgi:CRP/FNR family transcriptional regulator, cyclic AMP receptor protein